MGWTKSGKLECAKLISLNVRNDSAMLDVQLSEACEKGNKKSWLEERSSAHPHVRREALYEAQIHKEYSHSNNICSNFNPYLVNYFHVEYYWQ